MSRYSEVNIKDGMPTVAEAMNHLKKLIENSKKDSCIVIIHGYGSTGNGGTIRDKARQCLMDQKKNG